MNHREHREVEGEKQRASKRDREKHRGKKGMGIETQSGEEQFRQRDFALNREQFVNRPYNRAIQRCMIF